MTYEDHVRETLSDLTYWADAVEHGCQIDPQAAAIAASINAAADEIERGHAVTPQAAVTLGEATNVIAFDRGRYPPSRW